MEKTNEVHKAREQLKDEGHWAMGACREEEVYNTNKDVRMRRARWVRKAWALGTELKGG